MISFPLQTLFVITDGYKIGDKEFLTVKDLEKSSAPLKNKGVYIYSIIIGDIYDSNKLITIASGDRSIFRVWSENAWGIIAEAVIEQNCNAKDDLGE